ncbi:glycoside hydrolase family 66 protein, partial [Bacteroides cellulosilyticus]
YGASQIAGTGKVDFLYNEVWGDEADFTDLYTILKANHQYGNQALKTVFAAYMNYEKGSGEFNMPGILLTDAVMFALGGSHLELGGDHMLCSEYFPNTRLQMSDALKTAVVRYYDFMTAYQNLLRDGGEEEKLTLVCTDASKNLNLNTWPPQKSAITSFARRVNGKQVVHLLNFLSANSLSWRDLNGTMPEPRLVTKVPLKLNVAGKVSKVWVATPDAHAGASQELAFEQKDGAITFTLPSLKYWSMIVIE